MDGGGREETGVYAHWNLVYYTAGVRYVVRWML